MRNLNHRISSAPSLTGSFAVSLLCSLAWPGCGGGAPIGNPSDGDTNPDSGAPMVTLLCPEPNPFKPTLPNTVVIHDLVTSADATWTADKVYVLLDNYEVTGHSLTIEAGTTVCLTAATQQISR